MANKSVEKMKDITEGNVEKEKKGDIILGLDISTACIGASIVYDDGEKIPEIVKITHVVPKIDKNIKGIEALILRKEIFEKEFLTKIVDMGITKCVIEAPITYTMGSSNANTVAQLLQFNGLLSEAVYRVLGIVPDYITSYDARMKSFPELMSIRKFNKKGIVYPLKHVEDALKKEHLILFGSYPFDCDKKIIMMNMVCEMYPDIAWTYDKNNKLKKENFDACDSLVCVLAYINERRYGEMVPKITDYKIEKMMVKETIDGKEGDVEKNSIEYTMEVWGKKYLKKIII